MGFIRNALVLSVVLGLFSACNASDAPAKKAPAKEVVKPAPAKTVAKTEAAATANPAAKTPAPAAKAGKEDTLVVEARLIEIPGTLSPNDIYNYVYIMKYRVVKVLKGAYDGKELLVGHYNPLVPRIQVTDKMDALVDGNVSKFAEGQVQKLTLIQPISRVWNDAVQDEYFDSDLDKFYCLKADLIK